MQLLEEYKSDMRKLKTLLERGVDYRTVAAILAQSQYILKDYPDERKYCFAYSKAVKDIALRRYAETLKPEWDDLYWRAMLWEAPMLLDSYCLYIEKNRKPQERFYQPRRKTLKKVVDKLQALEDDELDELFLHQPPRTGKLIEDDVPVFTSNGWKKHGDLVVGDKLVGSDGKYTDVIAIHPKHHTTHTITFSDGTKINCHYNHEWLVYDRGAQKYKVIETQKMIKRVKNKEGRNNFLLPLRPVMEGSEKEFSLPPYVLGAWLGDGTNQKPCISNDKNDLQIIDKIKSLGFEIQHTYIHKTTGVVTSDFGKKLSDCLRKYGMCKRSYRTEKRIPTDYLTASIRQRIELLAGLLDTDGCLIEKEKRYHFSTTEEGLKDDFVALISSFGWRACVCKEEPKVSTSGIIGRKSVWTIGFNPTFHIPCVLERKRLFEFSKQKRISIEKIEESKEKSGNCITVSNADGIYMVGYHMLPTHNSQIITEATSWHCSRNTEISNLYVTYKEGLGGAFIDGCMEIWTDPTYCHNDIFPTKIARTDAKNHKVDLERKKKYATLSGKGLESGLNGEYDAYGWLILDDILEGIQDVLNPDILKRKQIVFDNNVMSRKKEQCKLILNGTIWSLHDLYMDRLNFLQSNPEAQSIRYDILKIPALDPKTDESNFDYEYGVGFTTAYYRTTRAKFEENDDMAGWLAQYQQEPIERDGALFKSEHMNFYNGVLPNEEPLKVVSACDVALGGLDYLSMPIAYVYEDGSVYIHDVVFDNSEKKYTMPKVVAAIINNKVTNAFFEANAGGEGYKDEVDAELKKKGYKTSLVSKYAQQMILSNGGHAAKTHQRKEQRIWDNAEEIRRFYFRDISCQSQEYRKFMTNLYSFTMTGKNKNDDSPDSLASLAVFLRKGSGVRTAQVINSPF